MGQIDVQGEPRSQRTEIRVEGALDLATSDEFRARILAAVEPDTVVVIDLTAVTAIDSVGLSAIVVANRAIGRCPGAHLLVVVPPEGPVRRMFELTLMHLTMEIRTAL